MNHLVGEPSETQLVNRKPASSVNRKPASSTDFVNILSFHTVCYFIDIPTLQKADFTATSLSYP